MKLYCIDFKDPWGGYRHLTAAPTKKRAIEKAFDAYLGSTLVLPEGSEVWIADASHNGPGLWKFERVQ